MRLIALFLAFIFLISCTPTRITVANYKDAVIYANGNYIGTGIAEIPRLGTRKPALITAKYQGKEVGSVQIVREFDAGSFFCGMFTYGVGFFICKKYPRNVIVPAEAPSNNFVKKTKKSWDESPGEMNTEAGRESKSAWDMPPKKIQEEALVNKWEQKPELENTTENFSDLFQETENQISFDSSNKIYVLTQELESKIQLFKIKDFKSANILKTANDSMFLQIETVAKNIKLHITDSNLQKMRQKVDAYLKN